MHKKVTKIFIVAIFTLVLCVLPTFSGNSILDLTKYNNTYSILTQYSENESDTIQNDASPQPTIEKSFCQYSSKEYVYVGGKPIGISIGAGGLIVIDKCSVETENGSIVPLKDSNIQKGDIILSINGKNVSSLYELRKAVEKSDDLTLKIKRGNTIFEQVVRLTLDKETGTKKIGLTLKENIGGIGTLTFVTQNGKYAALGHHIFDVESGLNEQLCTGNIYNVEIDGVVKGKRGKAGGLVANVNRLSTPIGNIHKNTNIGLYGDYTSSYDAEKVRIANWGEAKMGKAQVLTTINGAEPKLYDIDIVKVVSQNEVGEKGMVISVRDNELLQKTGGIVQGMSGSPILQNGLLIGAVTHVFVSDPTRGYAVHARFMYDSSQNQNSTNTGNLNAFNYSILNVA